MKVKYLRIGHPLSPQFDVSFPEKLLKIVATRGEICNLQFGNLPPDELEGCDIIIGGLPNVTDCDRRRREGVSFAAK